MRARRNRSKYCFEENHWQTRRIRRDYYMFCNTMGYGIKLAIFISLNNNGRTGFNVKIVSEICNSDDNLGRGRRGGGYVQRTIPHQETVAQSSPGPDWRLSGESIIIIGIPGKQSISCNLLLRFSFFYVICFFFRFWFFRYPCQGQWLDIVNKPIYTSYIILYV